MECEDNAKILSSRVLNCEKISNWNQFNMFTNFSPEPNWIWFIKCYGNFEDCLMGSRPLLFDGESSSFKRLKSQQQYFVTLLP